MNNNQKFTCAVCGKRYKKGWSDEDARQEYETNFKTNFNENNCEIVCDDCYNKMQDDYPVDEYLREEEYALSTDDLSLCDNIRDKYRVELHDLRNNFDKYKAFELYEKIWSEIFKMKLNEFLNI